MEYAEQELLDISGILQFSICRRRWALITLEGVWAENYHTVKGKLLHERVHDANRVESRGDTVITRGMDVRSFRLGVAGKCDAVEFKRDPDGVPLHGRDGLWLPYPVEYKKGNGSYMDGEVLQLCAQAVCLEEMLCCGIPSGAMFYFETRKRVPVEFSADLRSRLDAVCREMHEIYTGRKMPRPRKSKICGACSLNDACGVDAGYVSDVNAYIRAYLEEGRR